MKDDAPPQNPGMYFLYTYGQRWRLSPHAKHVCESAYMPTEFPMHRNAVQTTKHIPYPGWLLLGLTITRSGVKHRNLKRKPAVLSPFVGAE